MTDESSIPHPLDEIQEQSGEPTLDALFNTDPLALTEQDLDRIIAVMRERRALWQREEVEARTAGRRANPNAAKPAKPAKLSGPKKKITLADLGL